MIDPNQSAKEAGLRYVSDEVPGFYRKKKGKGFIYVDEKSKTVKSADTLLRIKELVIPPAWRDVWICKFPNGHLQVTGIDIRGRKQYRYHEKWSAKRNETKFDQLLELSKKLPFLKKRIDHDLSKRGMPKEKVLAAVVKIMMITQSRVGNSTYAEENDSYGLTTLLNKHAKAKSRNIHLAFRGKSGVEHEIDFKDAQLSKIIRNCQELPGEELFCYVDQKGSVVDVTSTQVNEYLKSATGVEITAKDLRTWGGTCKAIELVVQECPWKKSIKEISETSWKKRHVGVIKQTAEYLHNTVAICRKYYVHPMVFETDRTGKIFELWKTCKNSKALLREEALLIKLLKTR